MSFFCTIFLIIFASCLFLFSLLTVLRELLFEEEVLVAPVGLFSVLSAPVPPPGYCCCCFFFVDVLCELRFEELLCLVCFVFLHSFPPFFCFLLK